MTYIRINDTLYPATISGRVADGDWDNRESKSITLEMDYATAIALFVNGLAWSIVQKDEVPVYQMDENGEPVLDENGAPIQTGTEIQETEFDNSEYDLAGDLTDLAGDLTDHRDGRITAKMGKLTDLEQAYEIMLGGI